MLGWPRTTQRIYTCFLTTPPLSQRPSNLYLYIYKRPMCDSELFVAVCRLLPCGPSRVPLGWLAGWLAGCMELNIIPIIQHPQGSRVYITHNYRSADTDIATIGCYCYSVVLLNLLDGVTSNTYDAVFQQLLTRRMFECSIWNIREEGIIYHTSQ